MFSFFQRQTKPEISLRIECQSHILYSNAYVLTNGLILSIGICDPDDEKKNQTELLLLNPRNNTKMVEVILPVAYQVASNLSNDNQLLLRNKRDISDFAVLDCLALKIIDRVHICVDYYHCYHDYWLF